MPLVRSWHSRTGHHITVYDNADNKIEIVTSGGQIVISSKELREHGAVLDTALCVIDREAGGSGGLAENGIELRPLFTMTELKKFA